MAITRCSVLYTHLAEQTSHLQGDQTTHDVPADAGPRGCPPQRAPTVFAGLLATARRGPGALQEMLASEVGAGRPVIQGHPVSRPCPVRMTRLVGWASSAAVVPVVTKLRMCYALLASQAKAYAGHLRWCCCMAACAADLCLKPCELRLQVCHADNLNSQSESLCGRRCGTPRCETVTDRASAIAPPPPGCNAVQQRSSQHARCTQMGGCKQLRLHRWLRAWRDVKSWQQRTRRAAEFHSC